MAKQFNIKEAGAWLDKLGFTRLVLSQPDNPESGKTRARVFTHKGGLMVQWELQSPDGKVFHKNTPKSEAGSELCERLGAYRQCNILTPEGEYQLRRSKNGLYALSRGAGKAAAPAAGHNEEKNLIYPDGKPEEFFIRLGIMDKSGKVFPKAYDKFRQVNHYLALIKPLLDTLPKNKTLEMYDLCCGKAVLSFAAYYYLVKTLRRDVNLTGIDLKDDVTQSNSEIARALSIKAEFVRGDIGAFTPPRGADLVISLHACDTATDLALINAVRWRAGLIFASPCCHHELAAQINTKTLPPVTGYPILRERFAENLTDSLRCEALRLTGYKTDIIEFVETEHTHKNLLIRAVRTGKPAGVAEKAGFWQVCDEYGVKPSIAGMLSSQE